MRRTTKIDNFLRSHKKAVIAISLVVFCMLVLAISFSFAATTAVRSIILQSRNTNYNSEEPGSWQVEKSAKWISKGKARVTFDVNTVLKTDNQYTDVIFVLDTSASMKGNKIERVKEDVSELISTLLGNTNNRVALITFNSTSDIVVDLTDDEEILLNEVNGLVIGNNTNYYQALVNVNQILQQHEAEDGRNMIVLFLTDGFPTTDTPNEVTYYQYLKSEYPDVSIHGVQYEMGNEIYNSIKNISDVQFIATEENLNNVLFDASTIPIVYEKYQIIDYIDDEYFSLESENDITASQGSIKLENENGRQKITWTLDGLRSGDSPKLTMDLQLKNEYLGSGGYYSTNSEEQVISSIDNSHEDVSSTNTPILAEDFMVTYEANAPDGCRVTNIPTITHFSVFDTVEISKQEPVCDGYEFKGWELVTEGVTFVGDEYFIGPEKNVVFRAKWAKIGISKSMDGTVNTMGEPVMKKYVSNTSSDYHSSEYRTLITSVVTKNNMDVPITAIESWDVSDAGDGSVIAYIEDDGSGSGTYRVTIGAQGDIIANQDMSYLFYGFTSLQSVDFSHLDTSNTTRMSSMFYNCTSLVNMDLSDLDTSSLIDMSSMFYGCINLINVNLLQSDLSHVVDMSNLFYRCESLISMDFSNLNLSNVETMESLFNRCSSLTSVYFINVDTVNVTNMRWMFGSCSSLTQLDLSQLETNNVIDMYCMFYNCTNLSDLNISNFDTSKVEDFGWMFSDCSSLTSLDLRNFDTSSATFMGNMFQRCSNLVNVDVSSFNTSNVTSMRCMFVACQALRNLDLSNFDTSKVADMEDMFRNCYVLTTLNLSSFQFSNVANYNNFVYEDTSKNSYLTVTVKDSVASNWVKMRFNEAGLYGNYSIVIA